MYDLPKDHSLFPEISLLTEMLEAELEGRPFDREAARDLASQLSDKYDGIRYSMLLVRNRVAPELSAVA